MADSIMPGDQHAVTKGTGFFLPRRAKSLRPPITAGGAPISNKTLAGSTSDASDYTAQLTAGGLQSTHLQQHQQQQQQQQQQQGPNGASSAGAALTAAASRHHVPRGSINDNAPFTSERSSSSGSSSSNSSSCLSPPPDVSSPSHPGPFAAAAAANQAIRYMQQQQQQQEGNQPTAGSSGRINISGEWAPPKPLMQQQQHQQQQQQPPVPPPPPPPRQYCQSPFAAAATGTATATDTARGFSPRTSTASPSSNSLMSSSYRPAFRSAPIPVLQPALSAATATSTDLAGSLSSSLTQPLLLCNAAAGDAVGGSIHSSLNSHTHQQVMLQSAVEHPIGTATDQAAAAAVAGPGRAAAAAHFRSQGRSLSLNGRSQAALVSPACSRGDMEPLLAGCLPLGHGSSSFSQGMRVPASSTLQGYAAQQPLQLQLQQGMLGSSYPEAAVMQQVASGADFSGSNAAMNRVGQRLTPLQQQQQLGMTASLLSSSLPLPTAYELGQQHHSMQQQAAMWQQQMSCSLDGTSTLTLLPADEKPQQQEQQQQQEQEPDMIKAIEEELSQLLQMRQQVQESKAAARAANAAEAAAAARAAVATAAADRVAGLHEQQMLCRPVGTGSTSLYLAGSSGSAGLYCSVAGEMTGVQALPLPGPYACSSLCVPDNSSAINLVNQNASAALLGPGRSGSGSALPNMDDWQAMLEDLAGANNGCHSLSTGYDCLVAGDQQLPQQLLPPAGVAGVAAVAPASAASEQRNMLQLATESKLQQLAALRKMQLDLQLEIQQLLS